MIAEFGVLTSCSAGSSQSTCEDNRFHRPNLQPALEAHSPSLPELVTNKIKEFLGVSVKLYVKFKDRVALLHDTRIAQTKPQMSATVCRLSDVLDEVEQSLEEAYDDRA